MSSRFIMPFADVGSGIKPSSGAKLFFFEVDGVTPKNTFSDQLASPTPNANPVESDSNGVFGDIYISGKYKVTLKDKDLIQIFGGAEVEELFLASSTVTPVTAEYATTLDLISSTAVSSVGDIAGTAGYTSKGDGGGAKWKSNGVTGQTSSQSPAQLGNALLNDGNGNQWAFVGNSVNPLQLDSLQSALSSGLIVDINTQILATGLSVPQGAVIKGVKGKAKIKVAVDFTENLMNLQGAGVTITDVFFDMTGTQGVDTLGGVAISSEVDCSDITVSGCGFIGQAKRPYIALSANVVSSNINIENNDFIGPYTPFEIKAEFLGGGVRFLFDQLGNQNININNNRFSRIASNSIQARYSGGDIHTKGCFVNFSVTNNKFFDPGFSSVSGHTWIENISIDNYICTGNIMEGGGRGMSCGDVRGGVLASNTLSGLTSYGCEMGLSDGIEITGNALTDCANLVQDNGNTGDTQSKNIHIHGNTMKGGNNGTAGWNSPSSLRKISTNSNNEGYNNWTIEDNTFIDCDYNTEIIYIAGSVLTSSMDVKNNTFITNDTKLPPIQFVKYRFGSDSTCKGNKVYRFSDLTDASGISGSQAFFGYQGGASESNLKFIDNEVYFYGSDIRTSTANIDGIGQNAAAGSMPRMRIIGNTLHGNLDRPLNIIANDGDTIVKMNDDRGSTGLSFFNPSIIDIDNTKTIARSAAPVTLSWVKGDRVTNKVATVGQPTGWLCTASGSPGVWVALANL